MKKIILLSIISLSTFISAAQCVADFTWSVSGSTVYLTNTSSGTNSNDWMFGDGTNSSATNPTHTYSSPGSYNICLYSFYVDSLGGFCSDSICHQVTVIDSNVQCSADFTWSVSGNTVQLTNTSAGTNNNNWSFGDGGSSTMTNPTHTYSSPGIYTICLYSYYADSMGGFCSDSICHQVSVLDSNVQCSADFTWSVSGNTVQLTNTSTGTNNNDWSFGDGGSSTMTNPTYTYSSPGSYNICLYSYYADSMGGFCDDSVCYQITVSDSLDSTASVTTISFDKFELYPNPTNSVLNIKIDQLPSNSHARIVDLLGREMTQVDLTTQVTEIQVADFPSGIFIVQLINANNQIIGLHKFVRE